MLAAAQHPAAAQNEQTASQPPDDLAEARQALLAVAVGAADTPDGRAYLDVAHAEADSARAHLDKALLSGDDLASLKCEVGLALYAIDPQYGASGNSLGYGMQRALSQARAEMHHAARLVPQDDSPQVAAAAILAAQERAAEALDFGRVALAAPSSRVGHQAAKAMLRALDRAINGWDRDGDGHIEWQRGESGLTQAEGSVNALAFAMALH
jgi:hypothetical protein